MAITLLKEALAGELTCRQFETWCAERDVHPSITRWSGAWVVRVAERGDDHSVVSAQAPDLQDAITLFMSRVDGGR